MSEVQLPFPELTLPPRVPADSSRLLRLAVCCPRCGARPALRITEAAARAVAGEPPEKRLGTYQCHRRHCGQVYDLTAEAYQKALPASADAPGPPRDPLAAARARSTVARRRLLKRAGGVLAVGEVAERLGITVEAVQARSAEGTLLALPQPDGDFVYPACQFADAGVLPGLREVLAAFHEVDPWTQLGVLLAAAVQLDGRSALDVLRDGDVESARRIAATYGEHVG